MTYIYTVREYVLDDYGVAVEENNICYFSTLNKARTAINDLMVALFTDEEIATFTGWTRDEMTYITKRTPLYVPLRYDIGVVPLDIPMS